LKNVSEEFVMFVMHYSEGTDLTEAHECIVWPISFNYLTNIFNCLFHLLRVVLIKETKVRRRVDALQPWPRLTVTRSLKVVECPRWWQVCPEGA
jgi:hypothetical protein